MALLPIRQFGDPVLRQRTRDVDKLTRSHRRLIADMLETMRDAPGVGLAAPQVGVVDRIFVWEVEDEHGALVNPVIVSRSEATETDDEGCLSIPGLTFPVERSLTVEVRALDEKGHPLELHAEGFKARVFQHEIDHLDGVLFIDRLPDDLRKEALAMIREEMLGLAAPRAVGAEGSL